METQEITKRFERERALSEMSPDKMKIEDICDELVNCGKRMARVKFACECGAMTKLAEEGRIRALERELISRFKDLEFQCGVLRHAYENNFSFDGEEGSDA